MPYKNITFQEETSGKKSQTVWIATLIPKGYELQGENKSFSIDIQYTKDLICQLFSYKVQKEPSSFVIKRDGPKLYIQADVKQKKSQFVYDIRNTPWIQEFEFGLRPFLLSDHKSLKFCVIHPKDFDLHHLIATKENRETIQVQGKTFDTQKIKVTIPGFKSMFWKAYLWYDVKNYDLIMHQANRGPNTPTTTITFLAKSDS